MSSASRTRRRSAVSAEPAIRGEHAYDGRGDGGRRLVAMLLRDRCRLRRVDQTVAVGPPRRRTATCDLQLSVDVAQVELDRLLADPELLRDLAVRQAASERSYHRV